LRKIKEIMDILISYQVFRRIRFGGMIEFLNKIETGFKAISSQSYDPLAYRDRQFDEDYLNFQRDVTAIELEMENNVIQCTRDIPTVAQRILTLQRFDQLNLNSLKLGNRYIEVAEMLLKEIEEIQDKYNEERGNPSANRNIPYTTNRIIWVRTLHHKIRDPLNHLTKYTCVYEHPTTQMCVKKYNSLAAIFLNYETTIHKAWYTYVDQVRNKLEVPILRKNVDTNRYEINLNPYVIQVIKETEMMHKMNLEVPKMPAMLALCKDKVLNAYERINALVKRNDNLRMSIYPIFLPLMRIHLIKLERVFAPALSLITWLNLELDEYFDTIDKVLENLERFVKEVSDINDAQIEEPLEYLGNLILIVLPEDPITSSELEQINVQHQFEMLKIIQTKSKAAETSAIDLIKKFIDKADHIPFYDADSGKFQLPLEEINDRNRRIEEVKPINKYDWISFEKIFKNVGYASPEDNVQLCFNDYDGLNYDVTLLHIDCVELFAHYNHRMIAVFAKSVRRSMELLKVRSNVTGLVRSYDCNQGEFEPFLSVSIDLKIPKFYLVPSIEELQASYARILRNILDVFARVLSWGMQAKTPERALRRPLLDEIKHEKFWGTKIETQKDVSRYYLSFDNGLLYLKPEIERLLQKFYEKYHEIWSDEREAMIDDFIKVMPSTPDIKDKIIQYDALTESLKNTVKEKCLGILYIDITRMIDTIVEESKEWKKLLAEKLNSRFRVILEKNYKFIQKCTKLLARDIENLDECRIAINCLGELRENFIEVDNDLTLLEQTYNMFQKHHLYVPQEDIEHVEVLRLNFDQLIARSKVVSENVSKMQQPLLKELKAGVEKFKNDVKAFDDDYVVNGPQVEGITAKEASDRVLLFDGVVDDLQHRFEVFSAGEKLFGLKVNEYPELQKRRRDINYLNRLYKLYNDVMRTVDDYFKLPFAKINMEKINTEIQEFVNRCKLLPKGMKDWAAYIDLKQKIDDFNECCPLIELMTSYSMKPRHWEMLERILTYKLDTSDEDFTLGYVMKAPLLQHKEDIEEVCVGATKEQDIESKLQTIISEWKEINLPLTTYKNYPGEILIKTSDLQEIITKLEDSLMIMSSLASNRFNAPFKREITIWLHKLTDTTEILDRWIQVQNLWMYLEAVFVGGDISKQLPQEYKRFQNIDKAWRERVMGKAREHPNVIEVCTGDELVSTTLKFLIEQLELCQKSLIVYLESKRLIFPRFFFISDPVLLEILGQASDPNSIQVHLLSLFDGVARVEFDETRPNIIVAMKSANGESIPLVTPVKCSGLVEAWIGKLLEAVLETMKTILSSLGQTISDAKFDYKTQLSTLCAQAQLICIQLLWTKDAEYALHNCRKDKKIMAKKNFEIQDMLNFLVDQTVRDLTKLERISCETLVTIHVHQRDIFEELMKSKIRSAQDFEWQKQARFYYEMNQEEILVRITDIAFTYQNEYLGVTDRLAITPLTDRCYITLAQAVGMNMGGAPAGNYLYKIFFGNSKHD
jgi:dynein heavy chain